MKYDYHIHTEYSYDSFIKSDDLMQKAINLEYDEIAITEHLDLLPEELSVYGLPSLKKYRAYTQALQTKYPSITLRTGIEIGDYHRVRDFAYQLIAGFDFFPILGSVHFLSDHTNVAIALKKPLDKSQIRDYYKNNLELVSTCEIDVLAHLGVYKRYYDHCPDESYVLDIIADIFQVMIKRKIALEINLSSLHKPYRQTVPEPKYIELYRDLGGTLFSIGSDAHILDRFGDAHLIAESLGISLSLNRHPQAMPRN
jgi:histidinol-phosphatase (PHP family)